MIIAVGNAPSSGSTLLADLLDSLPFGVCGPEIRLFSVRAYFTSYDAIREAQRFVKSPSPSCYSGRLGIALSWLHTYGLSERMLKGFLAQEESFQGFCARFFKHFAALRGKDVRLAFEKTPQNIHNAKLFLDAFPDSIFVHIVRNPLYVYRSLRRRGFPEYAAASTWLVDEAPAYALRTHPRFYTIKYEELVQDPYGVVVHLAASVGESIQKGRLARLYQENKYRMLYTNKLPAWSIREHGKIRSANQGPIMDSDIAALKYMMKSRIGKMYAEVFGLPQVSFADVVSYYRYNFETMTASPIPLPIWPDNDSRRRLFRKWWRDFRKSDAKLTDLLAYMSPIVMA